MNYYVLITKSNESDYFIDSSSDNLKVLSKRMSVLSNLPKTEFSKIFKLSDVSSGRLYITDQIDEICKSMSKYRFYPVHKVTTSFNGINKIKFIHYIMSPEPDELNLNESIKSSVDNLIESLRKFNVSEMLNEDESNLSMENAKNNIEFIGMESWIPDSIGSYFTVKSDDSEDKVIESFMDYVSRHSGISLSNEEDDDFTKTCMDFQKLSGKRCSEFPIMDEVRKADKSDIVIIERDDMTRLHINQ